MVKISYCSTCKGRLHQLKQTYYSNLEALRNIDAEWIIVDYGCPDNTADELINLPITKEFVNNNKLKIYKFNKGIPFIMSLSKNLSHSLASGRIVFNLDIDNFIGDSFRQLTQVSSRQYLHAGWDTMAGGTKGRIGVHNTIFRQIGGYDLDLDVACYDDLDLVQRLEMLNLTRISETNIQYPIQNTNEDTLKYSETDKEYREVSLNSKTISQEKLSKGIIKANPDGMLIYKGEDMSKYLTQVVIDG